MPARTIERLIAVVVFPSEGTALATKVVLGGAPALESSNEVRSIRYASPASDEAPPYDNALALARADDGRPSIDLSASPAP